MTLSLPGQPRAEVLLRAALAGPAHAYLLHGPAGTGKRDAARAFAAALLGCDERRVVPGSHPDLAMIEPNLLIGHGDYHPAAGASFAKGFDLQVGITPWWSVRGAASGQGGA